MDQTEAVFVLLSAVLFAGGIATLAVSLRRSRERLATAEKRIAELLDAAKQADERATERDGRWRRIVEMAPQLVWTASADGRAAYVSPQSAAFTGLPQSQFLGWGWLEPMHPDDRESARQQWYRAVTEQRAYEAEHRFRRSDGVYRWFSCRGTPVRDGDGRVVEWVGVSVDVTDRKEFEARSEGAKQRLEALLRLSESAVWEFTLKDTSILTSYIGEDPRVRLRSEGYEPAEPMDFHSNMVRMLHPEDQEPVCRAIQACVDGETPEFQVEYRAIRKDGALRHRFARGIATRAPDGTPTGFMYASTDVTALKQAQEETRKNKERLERAVLGSKTCTWDFELPDGKLVNSQATFTNLWELLGYATANESPSYSQSLATLLPFDEQQQFATQLQSFLDGREREWEYELRARHKDRSDRWLFARGVAERDPISGLAVRFTGSSIDITDRKLMERALQRAKDLLDLAVRASRVSIFEFDMPDGKIENSRQTLINFWEMLGYDPAEAPSSFGAAVVRVLTPEDVRRVPQEIEAYLSGRIPRFDMEHQVRSKDGSFQWRLARGLAVRDQNGMAVRFIGSHVDITDKKRTEEALRKSEDDLRHVNERLELAMTSANQTIWEYDMPDGSLENSHQTLINVWESLGYDVPSDPSTSIAPMIHPDDRKYVGSKIQEYLSGQSNVFETEHRVRHKDGTYRWHLGRGVALRDGNGRPMRFVGTSVDITDIKRIEAELQRAREAAESANRAKDEFLANVSHEIRTPMNAILGMTELALDSARTDHQRQLLATVKSAARNLLSIINDLLDFSKIAAGKLALDQGHFSLRAELGDTVRALAARAHRKGLELICHVRPAVPDTLFGDAGRLRQVLMNLVGNAIKFTAQGEVVVEVRTAFDPAAADDVVALVLTVRDTGIGIARDKQRAIFRAFEQEDSSTTRKYGGTGLGLTISAQLAALMGGEISVESAPGEGSTFAFTARFALSTRPDLTRLPSSSELLLGLRVLVVDDNETNRRILGEWLTSWRMRPTTVGDAASALEELIRAEATGSPYGLVLLDGRMPDVDGITLAGQILGRYGPASKRLILLSSDDSPILATRSRAAGIRAYLLKPVQQSELLETIWVVMKTTGDAARDAKNNAARSDESAPGTRPATLRMLVAEDNELNVALLQELLRQRGHRAQFVGDGRAAVLQAGEGVFHLLLLDLHLPEMDGFAVVDAIRAHERTTGRHLPIIALTARSSNRDRERCLAAGMDEFLSKPIEADALWTAIDRMVAAFPPAKVRDSRLLDDRAILRACGGQARVLEKLCEVFRRSLPDQMVRVRAALRECDLPSLRETAHMLYGTLGAFSTIAGALALTIEDSALREDIESCTELCERLESMCSELLEDTRALTIDELSL